MLIVQNAQSEQLAFLGATVSGDKGRVVAGAVALGLVLAVLLLLPGWLASAWHRAHLHRQTQTLEKRLLTLREEHAQLHGGHQRLVDEHGLVLDRVLPSPSSLPSVPSVPPSRLAAPPPSEQTPQMTPLVADGAPSAAPGGATAQPTGVLSR